MKFLVISQRAIGDNNYSLKNLPGHGRIDILFRCILASTRSLNGSHQIFTYLKAGEKQGWLEYHESTDKEDEISLAHKISESWDDYFTPGSLDELLPLIYPSSIFYLTESGQKIGNERMDDEDLVILGAQRDLAEGDLSSIQNYVSSNQISYTDISLGDEAMLASQTITFLRQIQMNSNSPQ